MPEHYGIASSPKVRGHHSKRNCRFASPKTLHSSGNVGTIRLQSNRVYFRNQALMMSSLCIFILLGWVWVLLYCSPAFLSILLVFTIKYLGVHYLLREPSGCGSMISSIPILQTNFDLKKVLQKHSAVNLASSLFLRSTSHMLYAAGPFLMFFFLSAP